MAKWGAGDRITQPNGGYRAIPAGELTFCYGKSPFLMGKSTINGHSPWLC